MALMISPAPLLLFVLSLPPSGIQLRQLSVRPRHCAAPSLLPLRDEEGLVLVHDDQFEGVGVGDVEYII